MSHNRTQNISAECAALATVPGMVCGWTGGAGLAREVVSADGELYHGATKRSLLGHCEVTGRGLLQCLPQAPLDHPGHGAALVWLVVMVNIQLESRILAACCSVGDVSTLN